MAKLPGLFKRGSTYYLRVVIPLDLRHLYGHRCKVVRSLETACSITAKTRATTHRAEALTVFAHQRSPQAQRPFLPIPSGSSHGTPPPALAATKESGQTLRTTYQMWLKSAKRSSDTANTCKRAVALFEEFTGLPGPALSEITRRMGVDFRAWLIEPARGTTTKTARDRFTWVKSLLKFAAQELEAIPRSPWQGLDIQAATTHKRRPWTPDELALMFHRPLFLEYELPSDRLAGRDAAYWLPVLGLFTGARVSELAQLRISDVCLGSEPYLNITDEGDDQKVKTTAAVRRIPLHPELIRLGFVRYVKGLSGPRDCSLWPHLPQRATKPGGYFSNWFSAERRRIGLGRTPDFHCFRHNVRSQLVEAGIAEPLIDALIGHEAKGSTGAKVYTHASMAALQKAINRVRYPVLRLACAADFAAPSSRLKMLEKGPNAR